MEELLGLELEGWQWQWRHVNELGIHYYDHRYHRISVLLTSVVDP